MIPSPSIKISTHAANGFTLIELMIAIAVIGILASLATSAYGFAFGAAHHSAARMALLESLTIARNKATLTDYDVVMCPSASGMACENSIRWENGWLMFVDINDNEAFDTGTDALIKTQAALDERVHISTSSGRTRLQFQPNGSNAGSNTTFTICDNRGAKKASRIVMGNYGTLKSQNVTQLASTNCP